MTSIEKEKHSSVIKVNSHPVFPIRFIFPDPDPSLLGTTKLTGREKLSTYACWLGLSGPTDEENHVKMYKKYLFRFTTSLEQ